MPDSTSSVQMGLAATQVANVVNSLREDAEHCGSGLPIGFRAEEIAEYASDEDRSMTGRSRMGDPDLGEMEQVALSRIIKEHPDLSSSEATMLIHSFREFCMRSHSTGTAVTTQLAETNAEATSPPDIDSLRLVIADLIEFAEVCRSFLPDLDYEHLTTEAVEEIISKKNYVLAQLQARFSHRVPPPAGSLRAHSPASVPSESRNFDRTRAVHRITENTPLNLDEVVDLLMHARTGQHNQRSRPWYVLFTAVGVGVCVSALGVLFFYVGCGVHFFDVGSCSAHSKYLR